MNYRVRQPDFHQEDDHVPKRGVLAFLAMVFVVSAVLIAWTVPLVEGEFRALRPSGEFPERAIEARRMVSRVRSDLFAEQRPARSVFAAQRRDLATYGWVDRDRGIVRIPVERAMEIIAGGEGP